MRAGWPSHGSRYQLLCFGFSERQPQIPKWVNCWPPTDITLPSAVSDIAFVCVQLTYSLCHYGSPLSRLSCPLHFSPLPLFLCHLEIYQQSSDFVLKPLTKMSLRIGELEEDLCKASLGKHVFSNESPFIFQYILRLNTSLVSILSVRFELEQN